MGLYVLVCNTSVAGGSEGKESLNGGDIGAKIQMLESNYSRWLLGSSTNHEMSHGQRVTGQGGQVLN